MVGLTQRLVISHQPSGHEPCRRQCVTPKYLSSHGAAPCPQSPAPARARSRPYGGRPASTSYSTTPSAQRSDRSSARVRLSATAPCKPPCPPWSRSVSARLTGQLRDAEIEQLDFALRRDHDVGGLDISM